MRGRSRLSGCSDLYHYSVLFCSEQWKLIVSRGYLRALFLWTSNFIVCGIWTKFQGTFIKIWIFRDNQQNNILFMLEYHLDSSQIAICSDLCKELPFYWKFRDKSMKGSGSVINYSWNWKFNFICWWNIWAVTIIYIIFSFFSSLFFLLWYGDIISFDFKVFFSSMLYYPWF